MTTYEQQSSANPHLKEGVEYWHLGDYAKAGQCFLAGLTAAQANGDQLATGISSLYLGMIDLGNRQFEAARPRLQESLNIFQEEESAIHLALTLAGVGRVHDEMSSKVDARAAYLQSLQLSVEYQLVPSLLLVLSGVALQLAREVNQAPHLHPKAIEQLSRAITLYTVTIQHLEDGEPGDLTWFEAVFGQQIGHIVYDLAPDIVAEAQTKGKQLDLWPTAVELEAELIKLGWQKKATTSGNITAANRANLNSPPSMTNGFVAGEVRRKQLILLDKVQNAWVEGVLEPLEQSIRNADLISLRRLRLDTAVNTPWAKIIETDNNLEAIPPQESTLEIFLKTDRALLILGEPGGGKTTTLIQLARELIGQARTDPNQPIPVLLNLSTWAEMRGDLADWVVEELTAKYQIPRQLGRDWLEKNQLLLLLDGLDEMPPEAQPKCITAVNFFRQTHGLTGLAICCRRADYQVHDARLQLGGAILIQPLTRGQVDAYLTAAGFHTAVLIDLIEQDRALQELAESPLMLSIIRQAFSQEESDLSHLLKNAVARPDHDGSSRRFLFFDAFTERMFKRRGGHAPYLPAEINSNLAWLAQRMSEHNQSIFLIEQLQPSWLPDRKWRWAYLIFSRAILGFSIGILLWLTALLGQQAGLDLSDGVYSWVANRFQMPLNRAIFIFLTILCLLLGVLVGVFDGFIYDRQHKRKEPTADGRRLYRWYLAAVGFVVGVPTIILAAFFDQSLFALFLGMLTAVYFMNAIGYSRQGLNFREDIQTVEALSWSNRDAGRSLLLYGLPTSLIFGYLGWMIWGYVGIVSALNFALFFFLIGGMRSRHLEASSKLNQGIRLSLRNGLFAALIFGVLGGILYLLLFNILVGLTAFAMMALIAWFLYGGTVVLKHTGLRLMLWQNGRLPLNLRPFFNQVSDLIFMHRVGGGYMFTHRLLQEYFARLKNETPSGTVAPVPHEINDNKEREAASLPKPDSSLPHPSQLSPSTKRYVLDTLIATGTMGKVYRGQDTLNGQTVAVKQLRAYLVDEFPEAVNRFIREGEALQQLNHPNIVSVLDVVNDDEQYLIVTEYLPGSLRDLLDEQGQIPILQTVAICLELADALARAHHLNIIHRDVKPENILLAADGTPRLADFGVAHLGQRATRLTEEGGFMGTPLYVSPEICLGQPASPRSDIWSLGIVLYEMLAGRPPFEKQQVISTMLTIVNDPIPYLPKFRPDIPAALLFLIDQMLTKDPTERIGRMRRVAAELDRIYDDLRNPL